MAAGLADLAVSARKCPTNAGLIELQVKFICLHCQASRGTACPQASVNGLLLGVGAKASHGRVCEYRYF